MKTIQAIVELAREARPGEVLAMATVMNVRGSAYRRPGARMLMTADGRTAGMISGGCLENDVRERAREVMATGTPVLVTYDSTAPEDIVFGLGLGCNGIVQVLIEPLTAGDDTGLLAFLSACVARRQIGRVATVFQSDDVPLGARLLRWPDGSVTSTCDDPALSAALMQAFQENAARRTAVRRIELPDGRAPACSSKPSHRPCRSRSSARATTRSRSRSWPSSSAGTSPSSTPARPTPQPERFPMADAVHCLRPEALLAVRDVVLPPESMVMIMTHNFTHDRALLRVLLPRPLALPRHPRPEVAHRNACSTNSRTRAATSPTKPSPACTAPPDSTSARRRPRRSPFPSSAKCRPSSRNATAARSAIATRPIHDPVDQPFTTA